MMKSKHKGHTSARAHDAREVLDGKIKGKDKILCAPLCTSCLTGFAL